MPQVSTKCSKCLEPFTQTAMRAEQGVTICPRCRTKLDAFVQEIRGKIDSCPQSQSSLRSCIADVESNMATLADRNDLTQWELRRAHLIVEIGQLLLDGKIDDKGFRNLVKVLPAESSGGWRLDGTELVQAENPSGQKSYFTRYGPDGESCDGGSLRLEPVQFLEPIGPAIPRQTQRPASSGCLLVVVAIAVPLGFLLVRIMT